MQLWVTETWLAFLLPLSPVAGIPGRSWPEAEEITCRSSEYAAAKESFDQKYKRQQTVLRPLQPSVLIESLSKAAAKADQDSDALYEKFASGECTVDAFVAQYVKGRKLYHQRELKCQAAQQTL